MRSLKASLLILNLLLIPLLFLGIPVAKALPAGDTGRGSLKAEVVDTYVQVTEEGGTGSGVYLELNGEALVLTCAHMVEKNRVVRDGITTYRPLKLKKEKNGTVEYESLADVVQAGDSDEGVDLALLHPRKTGRVKPARWYAGLKLELGEDCWYIGTPAGIHARLERSILSQLDMVLGKHGGTFLGTNGCAWFGSSGGPVFVQREGHYYLCGIISRGGQDCGENPKCIGYAVDHATIRKFLDHYLNPPKKPAPLPGVIIIP